MIRNFLTIAARHLVRHKAFSLINIAGLALGLASSFMLLRYVDYELGYDRFHSNGQHLYRLTHSSYKNGNLEFKEATNWHGAAPAIKESFPEVVNYVRLHRADGMITYHGPDGALVSFHEKKSYYADSSFFSIFSFPLISGDPKQVLRNPSSVLLSKSTARKYFGTSNPIGKTISLTTEWAGGEYTVDGVFRDIPENSHLKFDFLFAINRLLTNDQFIYGAWYWTNFYTYLELKPGADPAQLESKLPLIIDKHIGSELKKVNREEKLSLQPLFDIHLHSDVALDTEEAGSFKMIEFLMIIALVVIGVAWLNYINLSTAKATERAREVGVRKVLGSRRGLLIKQFLLESLLVTSMAVVLAALLIVFTSPYFDSLVGREIPWKVSSQGFFWVAVLAVLVSGTFLSAFYPAFVISSFRPLSVLKGKLLGGQGGRSLRKGLVVFQFTSSLVLMIATMTVYHQLKFMEAQDLGISIEQRLVVRAPRLIHGSYLNAMDQFKDKLSTQSEVVSVATSSEVPGKEIFWGNFIRLAEAPEEAQKPSNLMAVDEAYIPTLEMTLLAGRNFSKERISDLGSSVIINESALRLLEIPSPEAAIGRKLVIAEGLPMEIIGVVKDFHNQSLQHATIQLVMQYIPWHNDFVTLAVTSPHMKETIGKIEAVYHQVFPENAFEYFFLDDQYNAQYRSEERLSQVFALFAALSIVVASMGLFGLASFLTLQRSKEIAIRKVVGATVQAITVLMSKDFVRLVAVAFAVATPLSWLLMDRWLSTYPYRIQQTVWTFVAAGFATFLIAICSVGYNAVRAAMANPVEAIKAE